MTVSMTAFARTEKQTPAGNMAWEIRSVNHRYLDLSFRLPDNFMLLEAKLREMVSRYLQRGKVDIFLRYQPIWQENQLKVDEKLVNQLTTLAKKFAQTEPSHHINSLELLRWPGVLQINKELNETLEQELLTLFNQALQSLISMRQREGQALESLLLQRLAAIKTHVQPIKARLPQLALQVKEKLLARLQEVNITHDQSRLEQELVYLAQKMDVHEELDRLETHLGEIEKMLQQGGVLGRRLDFLVQELHREINTLGSKLNDAAIAKSVVDIKVLIEQMREQIQNIE